MKATFYATLRQIVGQKTIEFVLNDGSTVQNLLNELLKQYPAMSQELIDAHGSVFGHVHFFVNGTDIANMEKPMDFILHNDDSVGLFPAIEGG